MNLKILLERLEGYKNMDPEALEIVFRDPLTAQLYPLDFVNFIGIDSDFEMSDEDIDGDWVQGALMFSSGG